jgi:hypothetical protein
MVEIELLEESRVWKTRTKKESVFIYLKKNPKANIYELTTEFPHITKKLLQDYKWQYSRGYGGLKYKNLISLFKGFYYNIYMAKTVPMSPLSDKELALVKQLEEILKNG